jgi:recombinational DNA repair protein RecT
MERSQAPQELPDEMSKRTVINRTCKRLINTSSDAILMDDELLDEELPTDTAK